MTRPMHDTLAAVKTASLELDAAVKARDEEIATAFPELAALRIRLVEVKAGIAAATEGVDRIKAKHAQAIADAEGVLVATRNARQVHLAAAKAAKK